MKNICSHHVGARSGNRAFPVLEKFEDDITNVLYDADESCLKQIERINLGLNSEITILPYYVGSTDLEKATFNLNYDPYTSSALDKNPDYDGWYFYFRNGGYDNIIKDTIKTIEKKEVPLRSLDSILHENQTLPKPDILSLDTQGSEYDILTGAVDTLKENVLAVITEVEFHEIYAGQKLYGDISRFLKEYDFDFVQFTKPIHEYSPYRNSIGLRGRGFQVCTDALYFKKIDKIASINDTIIRQTMLDKLAFIAIIYDQFEYALECLETSRQQGRINTNIEDNRYNYLLLLKDIENELLHLKGVFPPDFPKVYTYEQSKARFTEESTFQLTDRITPLDTGEIENFKDSNIELVLRNYGLHSQANVLKNIRIQQSHFI
ncbi:FkbM family methyltransferase [Chloroflexota bacterium]